MLIIFLKDSPPHTLMKGLWLESRAWRLACTLASYGAHTSECWGIYMAAGIITLVIILVRCMLYPLNHLLSPHDIFNGGKKCGKGWMIPEMLKTYFCYHWFLPLFHLFESLSLVAWEPSAIKSPLGMNLFVEVVCVGNVLSMPKWQLGS